MKRTKLVLLVLFALAVLAPATASAAPSAFATCPAGQTPANGTVNVYLTDQNPGTGGAASSDEVVGVCVPGRGYVEVGANAAQGSPAEPETYVVVQGYNGEGYVGLSNYENGNETNTCRSPREGDGNEGGTGTNSGGCYGTNTTYIDLRGGTLVNSEAIPGGAGPGVDLANVVPLPVCGDNTGPFAGNGANPPFPNPGSRDGCRADTEDLPPPIGNG